MVDFYRTKKEKESLEVEVPAGDLASSPERVTEAHFEQQRLRSAIQQLPGEQQQVVMLRFIEGFQNPEIAPLLDKSEGAVRVILHRALVKLRHILEKETEK